MGCSLSDHTGDGPSAQADSSDNALGGLGFGGSHGNLGAGVNGCHSGGNARGHGKPQRRYRPVEPAVSRLGWNSRWVTGVSAV